MLIMTGSTDNSVYYISRFNEINKYEIINHTTNEMFSGETQVFAYLDGGRINHTGITFNFEPNNLYTYQSFWYDEDSDEYYLANKTLIRTWDEERMDTYDVIEKPKYILKTK